MWRNRRSGGRAVGRSDPRSGGDFSARCHPEGPSGPEGSPGGTVGIPRLPVPRSRAYWSRGVILRALQRPKDLAGHEPQFARGRDLLGQCLGRIPVRQILRDLKVPQDDRGARGLRRCAGHPSAAAPQRPSAAGFTLIELLVVIAVIAILAGLVAPQVFSNVGDARSTAARAQIENFGLALDAYRLDNHQYPSTQQGLAALMTAPVGDPPAASWRGPYLRRALPADPWGHPYIYRAPGDSVPTGYDLLSLGKDGKPGGTGEDQDVTTWGPAR